MRMHHGDLARELTRRLTEVHGVCNASASTSDTVLHHYDPGATNTLEISSHLSRQQVPKMAELAYSSSRLIDAMVTDGKVHQPSRGRWPGWAYTTSPRPPCRPTASSTTSPRISATMSSGWVGVLLGELRDHRPPASINYNGLRCAVLSTFVRGPGAGTCQNVSRPPAFTSPPAAAPARGNVYETFANLGKILQ